MIFILVFFFFFFFFFPLPIYEVPPLHHVFGHISSNHSEEIVNFLDY